jgi:glucosamine-6-phosphate deaminase
MNQAQDKSILKYEFKSLENIPVSIVENAEKGSKMIAGIIADAIRDKQKKNQNIVLGLATGSSPVKVYKELIRLHQEDGLSFHNVVTFNLDEYYPMKPDAKQSYVRFMDEVLFSHIDIPRQQIHIPDGTVSMDEIKDYCHHYEQKIDELGGLDIQILGIGRTGHIGFNEPGSLENSKTRLVRLDSTTRRDASKDFGSEDEVPFKALTMGVSTILKAKQIILMAWGQNKAPMIKETLEGSISSQNPSSFLQKHPNTIVILDEQAASQLTRKDAPWLVSMVNWNDDLICKAVVWLSQKLHKPILKLTNEDYTENGLSDLIMDVASSYSLNIRIFNRLQHTITGWPGGKPNEDDTYRPERKEPGKKRVLIFSPHPDDDVISMGGTFLRLVDQGHEVHVAYQTSGNIAVHDHDALRFIEFVNEYAKAQGFFNSDFEQVYTSVIAYFQQKKLPDQIDIKEVQSIKGLIRRGEARAGARFCGIPDTQIHFLDMPFYETGKRTKKNIGPDDIKIVSDLLEKLKPHQIFAAGDLADPHDTHKVCLDAIISALHHLKTKEWVNDCWLWLYRGAWHEFDIHEIDMAIPLSPEELIKKRRAIFMHQSQKDRPPFPGDDEREFWQRAEERNRKTATTYRELGLAEYEAMEAFARYYY